MGKFSPKNIQVSREELYDLYVTRGLSTTKIGEIFECSGTCARALLIKHNIQLRTFKEAKKVLLAGDPGYIHRLRRGVAKAKIEGRYETSEKRSDRVKEQWKRPGMRDKMRVGGSYKRTDVIRERMKISLQSRQIKKHGTAPENKLEAILIDRGIEYKTQYSIGGYCVDFFLPEFVRYIEVHGDYWHVNPIKYTNGALIDSNVGRIRQTLSNDKNKKKWLLDEYGINIDVIWESDDYDNRVDSILKSKHVFNSSDKFECLDHYGKIGWPFYKTNGSVLNRSFELVKSIKCEDVFKDGLVLTSKRCGTDIVKNFFPNLFDKERSVFFKKLEAVIDNRLKYIGHVDDNVLMRGFKISGLVSGYSIFLPAVAKGIVERFVKPGSVVYDFASGWGARLLGTVLAGCKYIGCDKSYRTCCNNKTMASFFGINDDVSITCNDSTLNVPTVEVDAIFTCPPYYNIEKYGNESFASLDDYFSYLRKSLECGLKALKHDGKVLLVMSDKIDITEALSLCGLRLSDRFSIENQKSHFGRKAGESLLVIDRA